MVVIHKANPPEPHGASDATPSQYSPENPGHNGRENRCDRCEYVAYDRLTNPKGKGCYQAKSHCQKGDICLFMVRTNTEIGDKVPEISPSERNLNPYWPLEIVHPHILIPVSSRGLTIFAL